MLRALAMLLCLGCATAHAQQAQPDGPGPEHVDTTRLDVERLPPEALEPRRALYSRGLFVEGQLGGTTFVGDARDVAHGGPRLAIALGYELARWFALLIEVEGSQHQTHNRTPPAHTSFELVLASAGARFALPIRERHALFATALVGVAFTTRDVLRGLDFEDAHKPGIAYGGELGYDFHLPSRHHSLGVLSGARQLPGHARDGFTLAIHAAAYLRYVF
ncbi:MAG TPA: hypothetical protein VFX59_03535 [Polyangiales bacterium]|nr:hypothetical protein [Polyangiales bacterium]